MRASFEPSLMWLLAAAGMARLAWATRQSRLLEYVPPVEHLAPGVSAPRVSVVVPARNEARAIGACLDGLLAQNYPNLELLVVDDRSEDGTGQIVRQAAARDPRVRLVEGQPLPMGWIGKCWALHQGARTATGDWLLFVDADTRLLPGAVAGALAGAQRHQAPFFSILTRQELPTVWERLLMPAVLGAIAESLPVELVNNPHLPQFALVNGQFLLVRRDAYWNIGGHEAVRNQISEDAHIAQRAKRLAWRVWLGDGRDMASTRMYTSPGGFWEGWTKNLHAGIRLVPAEIPPGLVVYTAALVGPYWALYRAVRQRSGSLALAGLVQLGAALGLRRIADRAFGVPVPYVLAQPLGQVVFLALVATSFAKVLSGQGVTWKGRRYYAAQ